jgi:hypothetical protein
VKVASLAPEAKAAAREVGLDGNRSALLAAAKAVTPEAQVAAVKQWDAKREVALAKAAVARKSTKAAKQTEEKEFSLHGGIEEEIRAKIELETREALEKLEDELQSEKSESDFLRAKLDSYAHIKPTPKTTIGTFDAALAAYDALGPDDQLRFHEARPDPTLPAVPAADDDFEPAAFLTRAA